MAVVNIGTAPNDNSGDTLRSAFQKLNDWALGADARVALNPFLIGNTDGGPHLLQITRDSDGFPTSATVEWSDGSAGVLTITKNTTFFDIDGFTVTHADSGKTITQATVTRDANGNVTSIPALTIS